MLKITCGFLGKVVLSVLVLLAPVGWAEALAEISSCQTLNMPDTYRLTANITASGDCLVVGANGITIDLNGFQISGNGTGNGITDNAAYKNVVIRNGAI